jgi:hypothetical protein
MKTVVIRPYEFQDIPNMPQVHEDDRRKIFEIVEKEGGKLKRTVRLELNADSVALGNHYHTFDEEFTGYGPGVVYTASIDNPDDVTKQDLPSEGWAFTVPAGLVHAVVLRKNTLHITTSPELFVDGVNTHRVVIAP